jgi:hypothetical protein
VQNALFLLEKETVDPEVLKHLAARTLETGKEPENLMTFLAEQEE